MARERYLLNDEEDTIHSNVIELKTNKEKRANWWYYNKRKTIVISLIVLTVAYFIYTVTTNVKPDYTIGYVGTSFIDTDGFNIMEKELAKYGKDLNGDGEVVVWINDCSVSAENAEINQASTVLFITDMDAADSIIWIHDKNGYTFMKAEEDQIFDNITDGNKPDQIPLMDIPALAQIDFEGYKNPILTAEDLTDFLPDLSVSVRKFEGTATKNEAYYNESLELLENFKNDNKINE